MNIKKRPRNCKKHDAYHEAAHAVVAHICGFRTKEVCCFVSGEGISRYRSVEAEEQEEEPEVISFAYMSPARELDNSEFPFGLIISLAGICGVKQATPYLSYKSLVAQHGEADYFTARRNAHLTLFRSPLFWNMKESERNQIIEAYLRAAEKVVRELCKRSNVQKAIEALAMKLLDSPTSKLGEKDVSEVLDPLLRFSWGNPFIGEDEQKTKTSSINQQVS